MAQPDKNTETSEEGKEAAHVQNTPQQALEKRTALILILTNPCVKEKGKHQNKRVSTVLPEELQSCGWLSTGLAVAQKVEGTNKQKITSHVRQLFLTVI